MATPRFRNRQMSESGLLSIATNLLYQSFLDCPRADAKRRYRAIEAGKRVLLTELREEDGGHLRATLALDRSELRGKLSFTLLRDLTGQLVANFATALKQEQSLNSFADEKRRRIVFLLPAAVELERQVNMLVLCIDTGTPGELGMELMFIDPEQFQRQQATG